MPLSQPLREIAVKRHIWRAIAIYVLIAMVKKELQLNYWLYTGSQILSAPVFKKSPDFMRLTGRRLTKPTSTCL